jgi:hypothetical protein
VNVLREKRKGEEEKRNGKKEKWKEKRGEVLCLL